MGGRWQGSPYIAGFIGLVPSTAQNVVGSTLNNDTAHRDLPYLVSLFGLVGDER